MDNLLGIIKSIFNHLDSRILGHGERVAYIVYTLLKEENKYSIDDIKDAIVLSILHDIGAMRTDEVDDLISFDSKNTFPHCVYGYLFLKYFSPLKDKSHILLYHHTYEKDLNGVLKGVNHDICSLIHLADRIDVWLLTKKKNAEMFSNDNGYFSDKYYKAFLKANKDNYIVNMIESKEYLKTMEELNILFKQGEIKKYLEMIVYSIDFRSYQTVTHSLLIALIAVDIGKRMNLSPSTISNLYKSALLHDVGKVTTPSKILEKQGKLTDKEMEIMRMHVSSTEDILKGLVSYKVLYPAIHHHERIDGTGYPFGLKKKDLSISDNIIIISDIASALTMKRSYKEPFSKEKTLAILNDLCEKGKIDYTIYHILADNYDDIMLDINDKITLQEKKFENIKKEYELFTKKNKN